MTDLAELDALIIRNLEEIEQGYDRIEGEIEERLNKEAAEVFEEAAKGAGWFTMATALEKDFWLVKTGWQIEEGPAAESDHYLVIRTEFDSKQSDVSWAQTLVSGRLLLVIDSDAYTHNKWLSFLKKDNPANVVKRLTTLSGFRFEPDNKTESLALPVRIDQEALAQAFAGEIDFNEALAPLAAGLNEIVAQEALLDELARLVRKADA